MWLVTVSHTRVTINPDWLTGLSSMTTQAQIPSPHIKTLNLALKSILSSGCRRDKDGYYWITGRIDDMLNISGTAPTSAVGLQCLTTTASLGAWPCADVWSPVSLRPPDEHSRGGSSSDGACGRGRGCGGESASQGEGRVSVLLRHAEKQQGVQPNTGGGAKEPG